MKRVCVWCGHEIGKAAGEDDLVTHAICADCADKLVASTPFALEHFLDELPEPVLIVDDDVNVSYLNRSAQELVGKTPEQAFKRSGGEVFDCVFNALPGGCGRTIHCSGCTIRNSVTSTFRTGEPNVKVPATLNKNDPDDPIAVALVITTVKEGDVVLLRVDRVG
jgi:transcriptional regulator with PAS, ATPase and Fis domain